MVYKAAQISLEVTTNLFPPRALTSQKRGMCHFMRKPGAMKVCTCVTCSREPNNMLPKFPPFAGNGQKLQDEESKVSIELGFPVTWQKQFTLDGFNPSDDAVMSDDNYAQYFMFGGSDVMHDAIVDQQYK